MFSKFTTSDLNAYLESYYALEASDKDKAADEKLEPQNVKTGEPETEAGGEDLSAPLIYSHIVKSLHKNEISEKKIIHIIQDIAESNGDDISKELAEQMVKKTIE
jgi:hypothetical protein